MFLNGHVSHTIAIQILIYSQNTSKFLIQSFQYDHLESNHKIVIT